MIRQRTSAGKGCSDPQSPFNDAWGYIVFSRLKVLQCFVALVMRSQSLPHAGPHGACIQQWGHDDAQRLSYHIPLHALPWPGHGIPSGSAGFACRAAALPPSLTSGRWALRLCWPIREYGQWPYVPQPGRDVPHVSPWCAIPLPGSPLWPVVTLC